MMRILKKSIWHFGLGTALVVIATWWVMFRSTTHQSSSLAPEETSLTKKLHDDVRSLAALGERNISHIQALNAAALFIETRFHSMGLSPIRQTYSVNGQEVSNIEVILRGAILPQEVLVVGAHYDTADGSPGANDNATGVAAMLSLAEHFSRLTNDRTIRFVAFVNEEPPYFVGEYISSSFPYEGAAMPENTPGVSWSDHLSFWRAGFAAIMITDTAPLRYPYYHTPQDTPDKIDVKRFSQVVSGLIGVIVELSGKSGPRSQ